MRLRALLLLPSLLVACAAEEDSSSPSLTVLSPAADGVGATGDTVRLAARLKDRVDDPAQLALVVSSDLDGELCRRVAGVDGDASCSVVLGEGQHVLTFVAVDEAGNRSSRTRTWTVTADAVVEDDADGDGVLASEGDCDDADAGVYPGADEAENGLDDDCDGVVDEGTDAYDDDGDGFTEADGDCDDTDPAVSPGAVEVLDGDDEDCDGEIDEGTDTDDDLDGYSEADGDCDDTDGTVYPGAPEGVNGADDDCDGDIDEDTPLSDDDGDGVSEVDGDCDDADASAAPDLPELTDGVDNDCDGEVDEVDGSWAGTCTLALSGDIEESCESVLEVTIDRATSPALVGEGTCAGPDLAVVRLRGEPDGEEAWTIALELETGAGTFAGTELQFLRDADSLEGGLSAELAFDDGAVASADIACSLGR